MGFVYFRATPATQVLMGAFLKDAVHKGWHDDQRAMNDFLHEGNLSYALSGGRTTIPYHESKVVDRGAFFVSDGIGSSGRPVRVRLSLLPHLQYRRVCHLSPTSQRVTQFTSLTVAHCLAKKSGTKKETFLRAALGLWALPPKTSWPHERYPWAAGGGGVRPGLDTFLLQSTSLAQRLVSPSARVDEVGVACPLSPLCSSVSL